MQQLFMGVMSGTSLDHIDSALVDFSTKHLQLHTSHQTSFPPALRQACQDIIQHPVCSLDQLCQLDRWLGQCIAEHVLAHLELAKIEAHTIRAIGSHGQTLYHYPQPPYPSTLQIGDPNVIAANTGITTVADFRRRDMALGGQGAPLAPGFHQALLHNPTHQRAVVNLGGIANITLLPKQGEVQGFDCGPGNTLMDHWIQTHQQQPFDNQGHWAKQGSCKALLLKQLMHDPYFQKPIPKSTGREYFNAHWLKSYLDNFSDLKAQDVQRTLLELTAKIIALDIQRYQPDNQEVILCGGGCENDMLVQRIRELCVHSDVNTTESFGVPPQSIESMAWAWLAKQTLENLPGNLPSVTGASQATLLGGIYPAEKAPTLLLDLT